MTGDITVHRRWMKLIYVVFCGYASKFVCDCVIQLLVDAAHVFIVHLHTSYANSHHVPH